MQATHQKIQEKDFYATQITLSAVTRGAGARGCTTGLSRRASSHSPTASPRRPNPVSRGGTVAAAARSAVEAHGERAVVQPQRVLEADLVPVPLVPPR